MSHASSVSTAASSSNASSALLVCVHASFCSCACTSSCSVRVRGIESACASLCACVHGVELVAVQGVKSARRHVCVRVCSVESCTAPTCCLPSCTRTVSRRRHVIVGAELGCGQLWWGRFTGAPVHVHVLDDLDGVSAPWQSEEYITCWMYVGGLRRVRKEKERK